MTNRHAHQPQLCPTCLKELHTRIQAVPTETRHVVPCRHGAGVTVATVVVQGGHIAAWTLYGQLTEEHATALALKYLKVTAPLGAHVKRAGTH